MIDTANKTPIDLAKMTDAIDPSSSLSLAEKQPGRACPDCRAALVRETILIEMMGSAGAGVEIDVCDAHGTWFDQRELQQVATHLIREYGPAARQAAADAEAAKQEPPLVDPRNIAIGVAALTIGLLGVAVGGAGVPRTETDFMGRRVEIDLQGRRIDAVTRLPIK